MINNKIKIIKGPGFIIYYDPKGQGFEEFYYRDRTFKTHPIRYYSSSSIESQSNNCEILRNLQPTLTSGYIVGFADAEGNFSLSFTPDSSRTSGYRIIPEFKVTQKYLSVDVLCSIRNYLECGTVRIDNRTTGSLKFTVSGVKDILNKIIPFFDSHPLITSKQLDYQTWRECMIMIAKGLHLTNEGVLKIIELTRTMNSKRSFEERFKFTQSRCPNLKITPEWVQGFSDGSYYMI